MVKIVQLGNPALRAMSTEITLEEIKNSETKKILKDLTSALLSRDDGVAISAPQIAVNKRVFVVSGKVFDEDYIAGEDVKKDYDDLYLINPVITKTSKDKVSGEEGCLSIDNTFGMVERHRNVTVEFLDENGEKQTRGAGGLLARIFQHEIDHLDGILFIDKAKDLKDAKGNEKTI